jgi:hypothetical protein
VTRGKGESSVYKDGRGYWTVAVELPPLDGKRRRRVIRNKDKGIVLAKLDETRAELRKRGDIPTVNMTVEQWFTYWYEQIAVREVRPKTAERYRQITYKWVIPTIGSARLAGLSATIIRRVSDAMLRAGQSPDSANLAHRIMSASLEWAVREGRLGVNPAKMMAAPRKGVPDLDVLDLQETLDVYAHVRDNGGPEFALWATTLLTGARRGEIIGLEVDRISDVLDISWQLQRFTWQHGCGGECLRLRGADCPERHIQAPADYEYRHVKGGLFLTRPKSKNGWHHPARRSTRFDPRAAPRRVPAQRRRSRVHRPRSADRPERPLARLAGAAQADRHRSERAPPRPPSWSDRSPDPRGRRR